MLDPLLKLCKAIMGPFGITVLDSLTYHFKPQRKTFSEQKKEHRSTFGHTEGGRSCTCSPLEQPVGEAQHWVWVTCAVQWRGGKQGGKDFIPPENNRSQKRWSPTDLRPCISELKLFYTSIQKSSTVSEQSNCAQDFPFSLSFIWRNLYWWVDSLQISAPALMERIQ